MKKRATDRISARLIPMLLRPLVGLGSLTITVGGTTTEIRGSAAGPAGAMSIHDAGAVARAVVRGGGVGLAGTYINGEWDSPDLAALLELIVRNLDRRRSAATWEAVMQVSRRAWDRLRGSVEGTAVRTMVDHYDLGNEFYGAWLDPSMSYSSGIFTDGTDLEQAMRAKHERIAQRAGIRPGDRVLEIGCGWGAMAEYAATEFGCTVTAVTISPEQHAYVNRRMKESGMESQVEVLLADFREIRGKFDRVVSIEMIESVDEDSWSDLYEVIARSLVPGGTAALQVITIDDDLHTQMIGREEFIRSYIFPGGALPSLPILSQLGASAGLRWLGSSSHGNSYAQTLAAWDERFVAAWPEVSAGSGRFDERFYRMWRYYLAYCQAGFRTGRIDGVQVLYEKPASDRAGAGTNR
jgi:cyclopropane-fatty-acyl-phospholipid synthase